MRPTDFGLKAPEDRTPFPTNPLLDRNGGIAQMGKSRRGYSFGSLRRFDQYEKEARKSGFRVGPGCYAIEPDAINNFKAKKVPRYRHFETPHVGDKNGFYYAGHLLVYEEKFVSPKKAAQRISSRRKSAIINR